MKKIFVTKLFSKDENNSESKKSDMTMIIAGLLTFISLGLFGYCGFTTSPNWWFYGAYAVLTIGALSSMWKNLRKQRTLLYDVCALGVLLLSYYVVFLSDWAMSNNLKVFILILTGLFTLPYWEAFWGSSLRVGKLLDYYVDEVEIPKSPFVRRFQVIGLLTGLNTYLAYIGAKGDIVLAFAPMWFMWIEMVICLFYKESKMVAVWSANLLFAVGQLLTWTLPLYSEDKEIVIFGLGVIWGVIIICLPFFFSNILGGRYIATRDE